MAGSAILSTGLSASVLRAGQIIGRKGEEAYDQWGWGNKSGKRLDLYGLAQPSSKSNNTIWQSPFAPHCSSIIVPNLLCILIVQSMQLPTLACSLIHPPSKVTAITIYSPRINLKTSSITPISLLPFRNLDLPPLFYVALCSLIH
jgi:hypothetical protein